MESVSSTSGTSQPPSPPPPSAGGGAQPTPDPPKSPPDTKATDEQTQGSSIDGSTVHGDVRLENSIFHGDVYYQITQSQRRGTVRQFSLADGSVVTEAEELRAVEHFAGSADDGVALVRHLEERRVLLLAAEPGAGKVTAAKYAAFCLRQKGGCGQPALLVDPVERHVRLDLRRMPLKQAEMKDRVVIFRSALSRGNRDVADVFAKTDRAGWAELIQTLRERNAYLVFTATPGEVDAFRSAPAVQGVHRALAEHPDAVRRRHLDAHLEGLGESGAAPAEVLDALRAAAPLLVERFRFAPQLVEFADFFAGMAQPAMPVEQAVGLFENAGKRLLNDLDEDLDGFALALAHCAPDARGVAWIDYDRLRRHLLRWLRHDLNVKDPARAAEEDDAEPGDVRLDLSDASFLTRIRAVVEKDAATLADVVRFADGCSPSALWRILLQRHRRVLTAILPRLRDLAERPGPGGASLGVLAAQIVGRIGEIDPERVVEPMARLWAHAGLEKNALVGALFEGVLGSDEPRYRTRCLEYLRALHSGPSTGDRHDPVLAAVVAYPWVSFHDFPLAAGELRAVAAMHLVPLIEDGARVSQLAERVQAAAERAASGAGQVVREVLQDFVDRIYQPRGLVFVGIQAALASLCLGHGVTRVVRELRGWMRDGDAGMGVLLSLMFLHQEGIAAQLAAERVPVGEGDRGDETCGVIVRTLAGGDDDVRQMASFLADLYRAVTQPWAAAALVQRQFRERLQALLLTWIEDAMPVPALAVGMGALLEELAQVHAGGVGSIVHQLVRGGEFRRRHDLAAFAASLRL